MSVLSAYCIVFALERAYKNTQNNNKVNFCINLLLFYFINFLIKLIFIIKLLWRIGALVIFIFLNPGGRIFCKWSSSSTALPFIASIHLELLGKPALATNSHRRAIINIFEEKFEKDNPLESNGQNELEHDLDGEDIKERNSEYENDEINRTDVDSEENENEMDMVATHNNDEACEGAEEGAGGLLNSESPNIVQLKKQTPQILMNFNQLMHSVDKELKGINLTTSNEEIADILKNFLTSTQDSTQAIQKLKLILIREMISVQVNLI
eukprot:c20296_g1_i1.p1 GENE.c20296_g1_i1~~c20296_g1_i1.p1  ORF type:complete len:267 (-),score=78.58 c20296_g1_i1:163-963(-)